MDTEIARQRALDAAEPLFCSRGVGAVRMEDVREASGVSLRRLYQLFSSKEALAIECLQARDAKQHAGLLELLEGVKDPVARLLGVFDFFEAWFDTPDFAGCGWINSYGEFGTSSPRVAAAVREAKASFRHMLQAMVDDAGLPPELTDTLMVLTQGAIVCAAIEGRSEPAAHARAAAHTAIAAY